MLWGRVPDVFPGVDDGRRIRRSDVDAAHLCGAGRSVRQHHRRAGWFIWMEKTMSKNRIHSVEVRELIMVPEWLPRMIVEPELSAKMW